MASLGLPSAADDKAMREALKSFTQMDINNDGQLSLEEFRSGLGTLGMEKELVHILFNSFDKNGDGTIDQREFITGMAVMLHPDDTDEQITMAFDAYDTNKDGKLQLEELERVILALFGTMERMGIHDCRADAKATAEELYRHMDMDGKGHVTKEDYLRLAKANPDLLKKIGLGNSRATRSISRARSHLGATSNAHLGGAMGTGSLFGVPLRPPKSRKRGTTISFGQYAVKVSNTHACAWGWLAPRALYQRL